MFFTQSTPASASTVDHTFPPTSLAGLPHSQLSDFNNRIIYREIGMLLPVPSGLQDFSTATAPTVILDISDISRLFNVDPALFWCSYTIGLDSAFMKHDPAWVSATREPISIVIPELIGSTQSRYFTSLITDQTQGLQNTSQATLINTFPQRLTISCGVLDPLPSNQVLYHPNASRPAGGLDPITNQLGTPPYFLTQQITNITLRFFIRPNIEINHKTVWPHVSPPPEMMMFPQGRSVGGGGMVPIAMGGSGSSQQPDLGAREQEGPERLPQQPTPGAPGGAGRPSYRVGQYLNSSARLLRDIGDGISQFEGVTAPLVDIALTMSNSLVPPDRLVSNIETGLNSTGGEVGRQTGGFEEARMRALDSILAEHAKDNVRIPGPLRRGYIPHENYEGMPEGFEMTSDDWMRLHNQNLGVDDLPTLPRALREQPSTLGTFDSLPGVPQNVPEQRITAPWWEQPTESSLLSTKTSTAPTLDRRDFTRLSSIPESDPQGPPKISVSAGQEEAIYDSNHPTQTQSTGSLTAPPLPGSASQGGEYSFSTAGGSYLKFPPSGRFLSTHGAHSASFEKGLRERGSDNLGRYKTLIESMRGSDQPASAEEIVALATFAKLNAESSSPIVPIEPRNTYFERIGKHYVGRGEPPKDVQGLERILGLDITSSPESFRAFTTAVGKIMGIQNRTTTRTMMTPSSSAPMVAPVKRPRSVSGMIEEISGQPAVKKFVITKGEAMNEELSGKGWWSKFVIIKPPPGGQSDGEFSPGKGPDYQYRSMQF
jgi:hypothetical protein